MKSQLITVFTVLALVGLLTACADMGYSGSNNSSRGGHSGGHSHFSGTSK